MRFLVLQFIFHVLLIASSMAQHNVLTQGNEALKHRVSPQQKDSSYVVQKGELRFIQEERITILDEYMKSHPLKHDGFRIQLIFGTRDEVASTKSRFLVRWDYSAYESYLQPNFRLRIGDFSSRLEAEKLLSELKPHFPGAYIVQDKIEVPKQFR